MKFPKYYNIDMNRTLIRGMMLIDIVCALALSTFFIVYISQSSLSARSIFYRARERAQLISQFQSTLDTATSSLISTLTSTTSLIVTSHFYGNDRIEEDVSGLSFAYIRPAFIVGTEDVAGTPLCSIDFTDHSVVGTYKAVRPSINSLHINPISLPISTTLPLTDMQVRNGVAYVSSNSTIGADPDLFVFNIKDIHHVSIISSIHTGPGISAIALAGKRVFAAAASTANQLHVIRFDTLSAPVLESKYQLPLPLSSSTPVKSSSIFYYKNKIYLGVEKWDGDEVNIIDVSAPTNPAKMGGFDVGSKVNDVFVQNDILYVADSDEKQLRILNVYNPLQIQLQSSFSPSGGSRQEGRVLSYFEDTLDFGRTSGGFDIKTDHEFFIMSSSTLTQYPALSYASLNIPGGVYGLLQDRTNVYLATREINKEFQVLHKSVLYGTTTSYSLPTQPQKMTCDGDHIYVLSASAPVIYDITFN